MTWFSPLFCLKKGTDTVFNSLYLLNFKAKCPKNAPFTYISFQVNIRLLNVLLFSELKPIVGSVTVITSFSSHR